MVDHPEYPWQFDTMEDNPYLTESFIEEHPEIHFDSSKIIYNKNISIEFIQKTHSKYNGNSYWNTPIFNGIGICYRVGQISR